MVNCTIIQCIYKQICKQEALIAIGSIILIKSHIPETNIQGCLDNLQYLDSGHFLYRKFNEIIKRTDNTCLVHSIASKLLCINLNLSKGVYNCNNHKCYNYINSSCYGNENIFIIMMFHHLYIKLLTYLSYKFDFCKQNNNSLPFI